MADDAVYQRKHNVPRPGAVDAERNPTRLRSRKPRRVGPRDIDGNLRARVAHADDKYAAFLKLVDTAVRNGVQLDDVLGKTGRDGWRPRNLVAAHRHDYVCGLEPLVARIKNEPIPGARQALDPNPGLHGKFEPRRVGLEVIRDFILG